MTYSIRFLRSSQGILRVKAPFAEQRELIVQVLRKLEGKLRAEALPNVLPDTSPGLSLSLGLGAAARFGGRRLDGGLPLLLRRGPDGDGI